jgi:hypothetical protein
VFPHIHAQLQAIHASLNSISALIVLIVLVILIFMILGMNLFGGVLTLEYDAAKLALGARFTCFTGFTSL